MKTRAKSIPEGFSEVSWSGVGFLVGLTLFFSVNLLHQRALHAAFIETGTLPQAPAGASK